LIVSDQLLKPGLPYDSKVEKKNHFFIFFKFSEIKCVGGFHPPPLHVGGRDQKVVGDYFYLLILTSFLFKKNKNWGGGGLGSCMRRNAGVVVMRARTPLLVCASVKDCNLGIPKATFIFGTETTLYLPKCLQYVFQFACLKLLDHNPAADS
jgi:hypothetical protein